jgi:hypothetical protein
MHALEYLRLTQLGSAEPAVIVMYNDFLDSQKGRLLAYRKRKKRAFEFWWSGKLQVKNSASLKESARFQTALTQGMEAQQRRGPFTGPIIVEFHFWPASRNPPHVHQLAKHYLDLLLYAQDSNATSSVPRQIHQLRRVCQQELPADRLFER